MKPFIESVEDLHKAMQPLKDAVRAIIERFLDLFASEIKHPKR